MWQVLDESHLQTIDLGNDEDKVIGQTRHLSFHSSFSVRDLEDFPHLEPGMRLLVDRLVKSDM